jgi:predicted metal-dependent hydrolase
LPFDWNQGELAEGLRCYRNHEFFEAHEHWEAVWLRSAEPEKTFLQALIQTTAGFHHFQRGNFVGAASLLRGALRRLGAYKDEFGEVGVEPLRQSIRAWLRALEENKFRPNEVRPELPFPIIR